MEKLRVLTDSGYTFKPEYGAYEIAPEMWLCHLPQEGQFYIEHSNNQRRKLYGPVKGDPFVLLNPPPEKEAANIKRDIPRAGAVQIVVRSEKNGGVYVLESGEKVDLAGLKQYVSDSSQRNRKQFVLKAEKTVPYRVVQEAVRTIAEIPDAQLTLSVLDN